MRYQYTILLIFIFIGCNKKKNQTDGNIVEEKFYAYQENKSYCNRLIINYYDSHISENNNFLDYAPFSKEKIYEALDRKIINEFDSLIQKSKRTGYCCCPERNLTISFYNGTKKFDTYYVDTVELKDTVRIYERSFQFSYLAPKINWKKFLKKMDIIGVNEYFDSDLHKARRVFKYTQSNNLPVITSNRTSKNWMYHDGDFTVKVADVGNEVVASEIIEKIKKAYPADKFAIEIISQSRDIGENKNDNGYEEIIFRIYSSKKFYDNFNLYGPKSFFDKAVAEFYVLGSKDRLKGIDPIMQRDK